MLPPIFCRYILILIEVFPAHNYGQKYYTNIYLRQNKVYLNHHKLSLCGLQSSAPVNLSD